LANVSATAECNAALQEKISAIAEKVYGAAKVEYSEDAEKDIERYTRQGFAGLPICMAKTQYSFSGDAEKKGAPTGFTLVINRVGASVGAGFLVPLVGRALVLLSFSPISLVVRTILGGGFLVPLVGGGGGALL